MGCIGSTGGSRMPARLWIRCTTQRFHRSVKKRRVFSTFVPTFGFFPSTGDACLSAYREMPISNPAERDRKSLGRTLSRCSLPSSSQNKAVRVKAEADPPHRLIHCKVCKRSLAPTDREYILKYFLISRKQAAKHRV